MFRGAHEMLPQDHRSLAHSGFIATQAVLVYLRRHANVEEPGDSSLSPAVVVFKRIYRPVTIAVSLLLFLIVSIFFFPVMVCKGSWLTDLLKALQVGAVKLSSIMVEMPQSVLEEQKQSPYNERQDHDMSPGTAESDPGHSLPAAQDDKMWMSMPLAPPLWFLYLTETAGRKILWRGSVLGFSYYSLLLTSVLVVDAVLGMQQMASRLSLFVAVSVALAPLHSLWTHDMIARPSAANTTLWRGRWSITWYKTLLLPSLVFSGAHGLTMAIPLIMTQALGRWTLRWDLTSALRILAISTTCAILAMCVLLPAAIALTRVEAALLPGCEQNVISFDRRAIVVAGSSAQNSAYEIYLAPLVSAVRSIDRTVMRRVIKQYGKWVVELVLALGVHVP